MLLLLIGALGMVVPFVDYLVIVEFFYLLIPFAILFLASFLCVLICLHLKIKRLKKVLFAFSLLPIFILSQIASVLMVNKVQRFRSECIIKEIVYIQKITGKLPDTYAANGGIEYRRGRSRDNFKLIYSRGFMVREIYEHDSKTWKSYGWND
jgi:hypothetical protein